MSYNIEDTVRLNNLYDIYHKLLTKKQRLYFNYYFRDDFSLSEIAEIMNVSRNAVHLQIKKVSAYLEDYETKLKVLAKTKLRNKLIEEIKNRRDISEEIKTYLEKIEKV
ncbi:MAG: YlxM family DNA-binding protein [Bacillota bacterium]